MLPFRNSFLKIKYNVNLIFALIYLTKLKTFEFPNIAIPFSAANNLLRRLFTLQCSWTAEEQSIQTLGLVKKTLLKIKL